MKEEVGTKKVNSRSQIGSAVVVAMLALSLLVTFMAPVTADPDWLSGWPYRKPVTITGSSSSLSNYQVLVTADAASLISAGKLASDGSDLRFTTADGTTLLDYWIESGLNTGSTKIWVKVPTVPTGGTTIYRYYGNIGASSATSGAATFSFFDDFDNTNNWVKQKFYSFGDDAVSFSAPSGKLVITSTGNNRAGPTTTTAQLSQGQRTEAKMVTRTGNAETNQLLYHSYGNAYENDCYTTAPVNNVYAVWIAQNHVGTERWNGGAGSGDEVISYPYIEYRTTDYVHFGTREKGEVYSEDSPWNTANFKLAFYCCSTGTIEIDWVFVRNYAAPEPGATIGSEETPSAPSPSTATSSTGTFDLQNSAPTVTDFTLYDATETDTITEMTPQIEYALRIDLYDANKMTDISQIDVILKTHEIHSTDSDSVTDKATYRWTPSGWAFVGPASSTWGINVSACNQPAAMASTTGTWWVHFTPGKVARESSWDIYVEVTDTQSTTADKLKEIYGVLWYGELSTVDGSYSFGDLDPGTEDKTITDADHAVNVITVANGNYTLKSKSENWVNDSYGYTATLDWDGTLGVGHFALKNDGNGDVNTFNYVSTAYDTITDFGCVSGPTAEDGENRAIYQWLSVATSGLRPYHYSGTYYVQIANG